MKNLTEMMKKAQEMQSRMGQMQEELAAIEVTGEAGGGLVRVTLTGQGDMKKVDLDPTIFTAEEKDVVEDLIVAAHKTAKAKVAEAAQDKMKDLTGGIPMPEGFNLPF